MSILKNIDLITAEEKILKKKIVNFSKLKPSDYLKKNIYGNSSYYFSNRQTNNNNKYNHYNNII